MGEATSSYLNRKPRSLAEVKETTMPDIPPGYLTEEQAKQKWCPFSRAALTWREGRAFSDASPQAIVAVPVNRGGDISDLCCCIASECMAWRWADPEERLASDERRAADSRRGCCGLAGGVSYP